MKIDRKRGQQSIRALLPKRPLKSSGRAEPGGAQAPVEFRSASDFKALAAPKLKMEVPATPRRRVSEAASKGNSGVGQDSPKADGKLEKGQGPRLPGSVFPPSGSVGEALRRAGRGNVAVRGGGDLRQYARPSAAFGQLGAEGTPRQARPDPTIKGNKKVPTDVLAGDSAPPNLTLPDSLPAQARRPPTGVANVVQVQRSLGPDGRIANKGNTAPPSDTITIKGR